MIFCSASFHFLPLLLKVTILTACLVPRQEIGLVLYSASLCFCCVCVTVYCTTDIGLQPNCSYQIQQYRNISCFKLNFIMAVRKQKLKKLHRNTERLRTLNTLLSESLLTIQCVASQLRLASAFPL